MSSHLSFSSSFTKSDMLISQTNEFFAFASHVIIQYITRFQYSWLGFLLTILEGADGQTISATWSPHNGLDILRDLCYPTASQSGESQICVEIIKTSINVSLRK